MAKKGKTRKERESRLRRYGRWLGTGLAVCGVAEGSATLGTQVLKHYVDNQKKSRPFHEKLLAPVFAPNAEKKKIEKGMKKYKLNEVGIDYDDYIDRLKKSNKHYRSARFLTMGGLRLRKLTSKKKRYGSRTY